MDIITTLPQTIIETILCLLPLEEAARTSILSTEWRYKWTKIPKLEFNGYSVLKETTNEMKDLSWRCKIFYAIHQILLLRQGPIQEFTLITIADHTWFEFDQIILHLSRNHVIKKLKLSFLDDYACYSLPSSLFSLHHLTDLYLETCYFDRNRIFNGLFNGFGRLTSLTLKRISISREALLHLLYNCPSLKSLSLRIQEDNLEGNEKLNTMELFKCLPVIEHLTSDGYFVECVDLPPVLEELPTSLNHLKYFSMEQMCFSIVDVLAFILVLMKCSPNLEKIKLEVGSDDEYYVNGNLVKLEDFSAILEKYSDVWFERLIELQIEFFGNTKHELEFVKFILVRSPNLKKVILLLTCIGDKNEKLELLRILSRAPRASPVQIFVEEL